MYQAILDAKAKERARPIDSSVVKESEDDDEIEIVQDDNQEDWEEEEEAPRQEQAPSYRPLPPVPLPPPSTFRSDTMRNYKI